MPSETAIAAAEITGAWVTDDGQLRIDFRADGTFVEDFNGEKGAYDGEYTVEGSMLTLTTSSGITVHGTFTGDGLEVDGYELQRES